MEESVLNEILREHKKWLEGAGGQCAALGSADLPSADLRYATLRHADLSSADLSFADLSSADLSFANLSSADLSYADLSSADLRYANLRSADLSSANLSYADLSYADLSSANLSFANLPSADLSSANLSYADLRYANLRHADLSFANLSPPAMLLLCFWGEVSDELTLELMRYDASNHPDPTKFDTWAKGGSCPYSTGFGRSANFKEKRELWKPGKAKSARELVLMLFKEKDIKFADDI